MNRCAIGVVLALALVAAVPAHAQQAGRETSAATKALFDAVQARDIVAARISLTEGADVDAENENGQTAADLAVDNGYFDIAHMILAVRSQQRAGAATATPIALPPPPAPFPRAPLLDEEPAPEKRPEPQVGPPAVPQPAVGVAAAPMTAPAPKVDLPAPVSLIRPPRPVPPKTVPAPASAPSPTVPAPLPATPAPESKKSAPEPEPVSLIRAPQPVPPAAVRPQPPIAAAPAAPDPPVAPKVRMIEAPPPPRPTPPAENLWTPKVEPAQGEIAEAAPAAPDSEPAGPASALTDPVVNAISGVGDFFARTFSQDAQGDGALDPAAGDPAAPETAAPDAKAATDGGDPDAAVDQAALAVARADNTPEVVESAPLKGVALTLDGVNGLGHALDPKAAASCIVRRRGTVHFCVEPAAWPAEIAAALDVTTRIYEGDQAVVRYDGGVATRMYAMFPSDSFALMALDVQQRYGAPSARLTQRRGIISDRSRLNVVLRWISEDADGGGGATVLEVRKIDDIRGMMPDTRLGVIRLFRAGSEEIFKYLSESDFVLHRVREGSRNRFNR